MRRRDFLGVLGGAAMARGAEAQSSGRLPTIGFLGQSTPAAESQ
jgi:putative ABC transport system substrate-binding protein